VIAAGLVLPACRHAPVTPAAPAAASTAAPASAAKPAPVPVLREYVFRPGPTALLVARMDGAWDDTTRYHAGSLRQIRFVRKPLSAADAGAPPAQTELSLWPILPLPDERLLREPAAVDDLIKVMVAELKGHVVETRFDPIEVRRSDSRLVYFTATNRNPGAGELVHVTKGALFVNELPFVFTIEHDGEQARDEVFASLARWSGFGAANVVTPAARAPDHKRLGERCRAGDGLACGLLHEASDEEQRRKNGIAWLTAGCDAGSAFACGSLGGRYADGNGVAVDQARAAKILQRGCDAHGWLACLNALRLRSRKSPEAAPNDPETSKLLARACGYGGDRDGVCRATSVPARPRDAYVRAQEQACAGGYGFGCQLHGMAIEAGYGVTVDFAAARAAYQKACAAGDLWGCFRQALMTASVVEQAHLYTNACDQGSGPACYALAQPRYGQSADARRALLRRACDSSIEEACSGVIVDLMR
jgi:TPR repeat protein